MLLDQQIARSFPPAFVVARRASGVWQRGRTSFYGGGATFYRPDVFFSPSLIAYTHEPLLTSRRSHLPHTTVFIWTQLLLRSSNDHASVQFSVAHVDPATGTYTGQFTPIALSGYVRQKAESDMAVNASSIIWRTSGLSAELVNTDLFFLLSEVLIALVVCLSSTLIRLVLVTRSEQGWRLNG